MIISIIFILLFSDTIRKHHEHLILNQLTDYIPFFLSWKYIAVFEKPHPVCSGLLLHPLYIPATRDIMEAISLIV